MVVVMFPHSVPSPSNLTAFMILALIKIIWKNLHLFFCFIDLTPTHISWQPSVNASTHHTDRYANTELTVRRGQAFTITLYFNRPKQNGESLAFVTEIGNTPLA